MHITHLRKVGGSVMVTLPPALLDILQLRAGNSVGVAIDEGRLIIEPAARPKYVLADLLAQSDFDEPKDQEWVDGDGVGGEIL